MTPPRRRFTWSLVQRMATESAPSVVGGGVPDAPRVCGKRVFTGSHRAGHAWPLPRGFWADVTRITAVGRHAPMPPKVRVAARSTGCRARSRRHGGMPPYVPLFGLYVGRGDPTPPKFTWPPIQRMATWSAPSVVGGGVPDAPRVSGKRAFTGSHRAGHARPLPRGFGRRLTPSPPQFPRPSGSCGPAAAPRCLRAGASPSTPDPAIGRTCTQCASPLPSF